MSPKRLPLCVLLPLVLICVGCQRTTTTSKAPVDSPRQLAIRPPNSNSIDHSSPAKVAWAFLGAIRDGKHAETSELLTGLARDRLQGHGIVIQVGGDVSANYQVASPEFSADDPTSAHVPCTWGGGQHPHTQHFFLAMRHETRGWRIAGLVANANDVPEIFNFEAPTTLLQDLP